MFLSCSTVFLATAVLASAGNLGSLPPYTPDANADRMSIPAVYRWDLTVLFVNDGAWATELAATGEKLERLSSVHEMMDTPQGLAAYMTAYFVIELTTNRLSLYASLQKDGDTTNAEYGSRHQQALKLTGQVMDEGAVLRQSWSVRLCWYGPIAGGDGGRQ